LTVARSFAAGSSYETFGYFCAGARAPFSTYYSGIDRMSFSDEVVVATSNSLVSGFVRSGGFSNNLIGSGYFFGSAPSIERLDYQTNSTSAIPNVLPTSVSNGAATVSASSSYITGDVPTSVARLQRFDFSTETAQLLPSTLSSSRSYVAGGQSFRYGYYSGGYPPLNASISSMDRLDFSTESVSLSNNLPAIRAFHTAVSGGQSR